MRKEVRYSKILIFFVGNIAQILSTLSCDRELI